MQRRSNPSSAKVTAIRYARSCARFRKTVTLEQRDPEASSTEVVCVGSQRGSSGEENPHPTSNAGAHLGKDQLVHDRGGVPAAEPFEPILVAEVDQLGKEGSTIGNICQNTLVDCFQHEWDKTNNSRLEDGGVPSRPLSHHRACVGEGLGAAVTDGDAEDKHDVLSEQFEDVGKREDGNVAVLALVASVKDTANGGNDAEDGVDKV